MPVAKKKTKVLISFAVTAKLICTFVFWHMQNVGFVMTWLIYVSIIFFHIQNNVVFRMFLCFVLTL